MIEKIRPAVQRVAHEGDQTSKNQEFVSMLCEKKVRNTIEKNLQNSPILKEIKANGEIKFPVLFMVWTLVMLIGYNKNQHIRSMV